MIVIAKDLEIRGKEKKVSNKTNREYLIVRVEDETGKTIELLDWNTENYERYQKGVTANFELNLDIGKYINISIKNFNTTE
ncbi:MAG: hypothetical protein NC433_16915 [Clostridiales bacterium]|nr:hypothetical protein [Clostridiales bacterium]